MESNKPELTLFYQGPLSQWHSCRFQAAGHEFVCAEQYMMYGKAMLFGDQQRAKEIMATESPREHKALGRKVSGFDPATWTLFREGIVYSANLAKFSQNEDLKATLLATGSTLIVEAAPRDQIWGIGLSASNPKAQDPALWRGKNLLGLALTRVREAIRWADAYY